MPGETFEVSKYILKLGYKMKATWNDSTVEAQGILACYGDDTQRLIVYGLHPDSPVPPSAVCNWSARVGAIFVPFAHLATYVDAVRNEKPVYARLSSEHPESMVLGTEMEPIGEAE